MTSAPSARRRTSPSALRIPAITELRVSGKAPTDVRYTKAEAAPNQASWGPATCALLAMRCRGWIRSSGWFGAGVSGAGRGIALLLGRGDGIEGSWVRTGSPQAPGFDGPESNWCSVPAFLAQNGLCWFCAGPIGHFRSSRVWTRHGSRAKCLIWRPIGAAATYRDSLQTDSKSRSRKAVRVRFPSPAPNQSVTYRLAERLLISPMRHQLCPFEKRTLRGAAAHLKWVPSRGQAGPRAGDSQHRQDASCWRLSSPASAATSSRTRARLKRTLSPCFDRRTT